MKKIILSIVIFSCKLAAIIWSYSASVRYRFFLTKLHTYWISTEFKSLGSCSIGYPIALKGGKYITIGDKTGLGKRGILAAWDNYMEDVFTPEIIIGNNVSIGEDYHITAINKIVIGDNVLMGKKITITDNSHGKAEIESLKKAPSKRALYSKGPVIIEDGVWIGEKVTLLPGITIGKNSIIGANAVVTKSMPPNTVIGGNPAKVIKTIN